MHKEDPNLPGYTKEGAKAGAAAVIYPAGDAATAIDGWMATLFHRIPMLDPQLGRIGIGFAKGGPYGGFLVVDTIQGRDGKPAAKPVLYPADGQENVPLKFTRELPDPLPEKGKEAGYPITAGFPLNVPVKDVTGSLRTADGTEVEVWLSTPEKPAKDQKNFQRNTVCLIPQAPLAPATTYTVSLQGKVSQKAWSQKWTFTTGKK
jgi:hypothetical protein